MAKELNIMTFEEVADYIKTGPGIVILPVGSIEQHGPHATLGIDTFATMAVARPLAEELDAVLAPDVPYGVSTPHRQYPGTISLKPSTLTSLLVEIGTEILSHGFRLLMLITGHRGNEPAIKCAVDEIPHKPGVHILALAYQDANKGRMDFILRKAKGQVLKEDMAYGSDGHGGSCECSLALVEKPQCVRMERRLVPDRTRVDIRRNLGFTAPLPIDQYATKGIFGDPSNISREYGEYLAVETAKEIARRVREYLKVFGQ
jgi:creatinine amidohydrolase